MSVLEESARAAWAEHLRNQPAAEDVDEPVAESAAEFVADEPEAAYEPVAAPASVYDAAEAVAALNHHYVDAALQYAAAVVAENVELRKIAAAALVQAREVAMLREQIGLPSYANDADELPEVEPVRRRWWRWFR